MPPRQFLIVIGAMKAGTTSLFHHLADHPQIAPCDEKEPAFFVRPHKWERGLSWYQDLWSTWDGDRHAVAMEATTAYSKRPRYMGAPERMAQAAKEHDLDLRFLYVLRDPLDRITSHVTHAIAGGREDQHHLEGIRARSLEGHTLECTMYATQLDAYLERFGRERFHLLSFEAFKDDPHTALADVVGFLDLDEHSFPDQPPRLNPSVGKFDKGSMWTWMERSGAIRAADLVPEAIKGPLRDVMGDKIEERIELTDTQRTFLLRALRQDLVHLRETYGFEVEAWPTWQALVDRGEV